MLTNQREIEPDIAGLPWTHAGIAARRPVVAETAQRPEPDRISAPHIPGRAHRPTGFGARPAHAADVAQAHLFQAILHSEIAELENLVAGAEDRWLRCCDRGIDNPDSPPEALIRLRGRTAEVRRLFEALQARFLLA